MSSCWQEGVKLLEQDCKIPSESVDDNNNIIGNGTVIRDLECHS